MSSVHGKQEVGITEIELLGLEQREFAMLVKQKISLCVSELTEQMH